MARGELAVVQRRSRRTVPAAAVVIAVVIFYPLSFAPVAWTLFVGAHFGILGEDTAHAILRGLYAPIVLATEHSQLASRAVDRYAELWGLL